MSGRLPRTKQKCSLCRRIFIKKHTCHHRSLKEQSHILLQCRNDTTNKFSDRASAEKQILGTNSEVLPQHSDVEIINFGEHLIQQPNKLPAYEVLLHSITTYFANSCSSMKFDGQGALLAPNGAKSLNNLCTEFDSYCFNATVLFKKEKYAELRCTLGKACNLVEQIIRAEHPRTLACFFEVFTHLIQSGLHKIATSLRHFISAMSEMVPLEGRPWGQILRLLGKIDLDSSEGAIARAWECITDACDRKLSSQSPLAVSIRLDYIKRVCAINNHSEEERLLQKLLKELPKEGIPSLAIPRVKLNLAHNMSRQGHYLKAETLALQVQQLLCRDAIHDEEHAKRIECLKIIAYNQFKRGCSEHAEENMRKAITMIVNKLGPHHSWVSEFKNVLEDWLRGWGRVEDADELWKEIEKSVGQDESNWQDESNEQGNRMCGN